PGPVWDGGDPAGRRILVHAEQGFGDTIQFARYLPLIAARGGMPILACGGPLLRLLAGLPGVTVVAKDRKLPDYDCWIDQMSLPHAFGTALDTIPSAGGYLTPEPGLVSLWQEKLPPGRKIGLVWAGNSLHSNDRRRSIPPAALRPLLSLPGIAWINLQIGAACCTGSTAPGTRRCGCSGKRHSVTGSPLSKTLPAHFGARHIAYNCHHPNGRERALKRRAVMPLHVKLIFGSLACPHQEINNQMADYPADTLDRQDYPDAMSERTSVLETLAAETRIVLTSLR